MSKVVGIRPNSWDCAIVALDEITRAGNALKTVCVALMAVRKRTTNLCMGIDVLASHPLESERNLPLVMGQSDSTAQSSGTEGERRTFPVHSLTTTMATRKAPQPTRHLALLTVPVVVRSGERRMIVNALLDDGSTNTYINGDVTAELGLEGSIPRSTVNLLNGEEDSFETMPVEFDLRWQLEGPSKIFSIYSNTSDWKHAAS